MKILSAEQTRKADAYTIANEPIKSIDLMERASQAFVNWFTLTFSVDKSILTNCRHRQLTCFYTRKVW